MTREQKSQDEYKPGDIEPVVNIVKEERREEETQATFTLGLATELAQQSYDHHGVAFDAGKNLLTRSGHRANMTNLRVVDEGDLVKANRSLLDGSDREGFRVESDEVKDTVMAATILANSPMARVTIDGEEQAIQPLTGHHNMIPIKHIKPMCQHLIRVVDTLRDSFQHYQTKINGLANGARKNRNQLKLKQVRQMLQGAEFLLRQYQLIQNKHHQVHESTGTQLGLGSSGMLHLLHRCTPAGVLAPRDVQGIDHQWLGRINATHKTAGDKANSGSLGLTRALVGMINRNAHTHIKGPGSQMTSSIDAILKGPKKHTLNALIAAVVDRTRNKVRKNKVWGLGDEGDTKTLIVIAQLQHYEKFQPASGDCMLYLHDELFNHMDLRALRVKLPLIAHIEQCKRDAMSLLNNQSKGRDMGDLNDLYDNELYAALKEIDFSALDESLSAAEAQSLVQRYAVAITQKASNAVTGAIREHDEAARVVKEMANGGARLFRSVQRSIAATLNPPPPVYLVTMDLTRRGLEITARRMPGR